MTDTYNPQEQYYIVDSFGNYYRQDSEGQLIAAACQNEAFTFYGTEVEEKLGSGKRARYYKAIPARINQELSVDGNAGSEDAADDPGEIYSRNDTPAPAVPVL